MLKVYNDFLKEHGDKKVTFNSYYKYCFTFVGDEGLVVSVGGHHDDIYKMEVIKDKEYTVSELEPDFASLNDKVLLYKYP
jgi:hypothetical protein